MSGTNCHCTFLKLAAGISLVLFNILICESGYSIGLQTLPSDLEFQTDKARTSKILTALLFQNNRLYRKSSQLWASLPQKDDQVQTHLYYNKLVLSRYVLPKNPPKNEKTSLLVSRYQSWQRQWSQALKTLEGIGDNDVSNQVWMEQIRLHLLLGNYDKAGTIIKRVKPDNHRVQMQLEVFSIWMNILKGIKKPATNGIDKLEENYLYLPLSTMFPLGYTDSDGNLEKTLKSMLMRFPGNPEMFEQLILFCKKHKKWKLLDDLIISQKFVDSTKIDWVLLAEVYLQTGQIRRLEKLIKSQNTLTVGPDFYDLLARLAIKRKNWELLNQVSKSLRSQFPQLLDGSLYQAIYLHETGRKGKADVLLRDLGL